MKRLPVKHVTFYGEADDELIVRHSNRGEPFRAGIELVSPAGSIFLEGREARQLRDLLNRLYPPADEMRDLLHRNLDAWENEETSVQEEHEDLIDDLRHFLVG